VAIRKAWALARKEQREAGPRDDDPREVAARRPAPLDADGAFATRAALDALAALSERERRYLTLKTAGYSYKEIADRCGVTYTKVNRCMAEGRQAFLARFAAIYGGAG
jgi:DNA-directed RNA polymerase specialized sigma24 family protein